MLGCDRLKPRYQFPLVEITLTLLSPQRVQECRLWESFCGYNCLLDFKKAINSKIKPRTFEFLHAARHPYSAYSGAVMFPLHSLLSVVPETPLLPYPFHADRAQAYDSASVVSFTSL